MACDEETWKIRHAGSCRKPNATHSPLSGRAPTKTYLAGGRAAHRSHLPSARPQPARRRRTAFPCGQPPGPCRPPPRAAASRPAGRQRLSRGAPRRGPAARSLPGPHRVQPEAVLLQRRLRPPLAARLAIVPVAEVAPALPAALAAQPPVGQRRGRRRTPRAAAPPHRPAAHGHR